jgi:hypothetical protein
MIDVCGAIIIIMKNSLNFSTTTNTTPTKSTLYT